MYGPDPLLELAIGNKDKIVQQIVKIVQTKKAQIMTFFRK